jgi:DNA-directed RNA polymerase subunit RPC12/RpoP
MLAGGLSMTSVEAIMNRVIDRMNPVPDCDVIKVCLEYNTTERIDSDRMGLFYHYLPVAQGKILHAMILHYECPSCGQSMPSAQAINADGSIHRRCPYCGREW